MAGYIHDPLQIINLIADNLRDRYKSGFPVLKEIIQNADDALTTGESVQIEFALSKRLLNADHPLLQGPALYFLNNGAFPKSDYKEIRSFGMNRKAIEQSSIGKFGLGMKSVFHFCEAFFFMAKNAEKQYAEILNPWSGGENFHSFHDDWNNFSLQDKTLMLDYINPLLENMDLSRGSWFLLWLPLRRKDHLQVNGGEVGSIISEFPGDDQRLLSFLFEPDLAQKLASLLPLLRRVNKVRFWNANGIEQSTPDFHISLDNDSTRIGKTENVQSIIELEGSINHQKTGEHSVPYVLNYSGRGGLLDNADLNLLRRSSFWPKSYVRDEMGMSKEAPDKIRGHSAVVFSRSNENERGKLKIHWAVFLPLEAAKEEVFCDGDTCYRLTLHGDFFIDAGRVDIEGLSGDDKHVDIQNEPQNELELRRLWNIRLAQTGTLPLILPSLEAFIKKDRLSADDIWHLSNGLENTKLFKRYKKIICRDYIWAYCMTIKGKEWRLLPSDEIVLPLPSPPLSAPERPWKTFTTLEAFENKGIKLLINNAPHLLAIPLQQWNETYLLQLLQLREKEVFSEQGTLDYLLSFFSDPAVSPFLNVESLQERLQEIIGKAFIDLGTGLRQYRKKVQEFTALIHADRKYVVMRDAPEIIQHLQKCSTYSLVLAREFDSPVNPGKAVLSIEDSLKLLERIHALISQFELKNNQKEIDNCLAIARDILQSHNEEQRRILLVEIRHLRILEGYDCLASKLSALSAAELEGCKVSHLLFLYSQGINDQQRRGLAPELQQVIEDRIILIHSKTASLIFGRDNQLVPCYADSVLDSLGKEKLKLQSPLNQEGKSSPMLRGPIFHQSNEYEG